MLRNMCRFPHSVSFPRFFTHAWCLLFLEQVSSHQTTLSTSSDQQRTTFETESIGPLFEEAKAKQGGNLPEVDVGEVDLHWSHS